MSDNGHVPAIPSRKELERRGVKIVVGIPMERTFNNSAFFHFWHIARRGYPITPFVYGRTDLNRNKMAWWLANDGKEYTHIVMLDADHLHPEDIVERLARWVLQDRSRLVVGGINFRRTQPFDPCIFRWNAEGKMQAIEQWEPGLVEVDAIGHGCILISRKVFEKLEPPWWAYGYNWADQNAYPSEDMYFCQVLRAAEIKMWADTTTSSPHLTDMVVHEGTFRNYIAQYPQMRPAMGRDATEAIKELQREQVKA
jgi:hypothetical protein